MSLDLNLASACLLPVVGVSWEEIDWVMEWSTSRRKKKVIGEKGMNFRFRQLSAAERSNRK